MRGLGPQCRGESPRGQQWRRDAPADALQLVADGSGLADESPERGRDLGQRLRRPVARQAELNLEREAVNAAALNASLASPEQKYVFGLDRETEISVYRGARKDGEYYRVSMLSWFVNVTPEGATKTVDYDANILLKPGQTAVFKLMGDDEVKRSGAARSHMAITLRSVAAVNSASLERSRGSFASR